MIMKIYRNNILIEASTVDNLDDNIHRGFPDTKKRQHDAPSVQLSNISYVNYPFNKALKVDSIARGENGNYKQSILFSDVIFETIANDSNVTISCSGKLVHLLPIQLSDSNVKVSCNCLDFHHRFAYFNHDDESLYGQKPDPYVRKTTTRPPANPMKVPGMCKHLIKLVDTLQKRNIVI